ncbi:uncharacterized protein LOC129743302 [Uranotaenia lowii]|uniref:uncharacterized protein LOC129743302 n=1 Tax=Uranotaenia lowii TaxID=190385 RepID=UPI00247A62F6|nr:uncharacterized protein LOC129743302 [Uranotaenia lowii]
MHSANRVRGSARLNRRHQQPVPEQDVGLAMRANEVEAVLSEFDPDNKRNQSAEEWLNEIDSMAEIFGWDQRRTLLYTCMSLKGPAKFWYDGCKQQLRSWEIFKEQFLENFPTVIDSASIHKKLINLKRKPDQSIESYFHETVAMGRKIRLSDDLIKEYLIKGLPYASTRAVMAQEANGTLPQFLSALMRVDRATKDNDKRDTFSSGRSGFTKTPARKSMDTSQGTFAPNRSGQTPRAQTPRGATTNIVTEPGTSRGAQGFSISGGIKPHHQINNVVYQKTAVIKDASVNAFIDLGSERTIIGEGVARKLQLNIEPDSSILKGFAGGECRVLGTTTEAIQIDGFTNQVAILIVPDYAMKYELMIGDDFFQQRGVSVERTMDGVTIRHEQPVVMTVQTGKQSISKKLLIVNDLLIESSAAPISKQQLVKLVNQYRDCFAISTNEIGFTKLETMHIRLKEDRVIRHVPYRVAYGQQKYLRDEIDEMLRNDIIEESSSEFASPVVIVPKKTGGFRMCVDYRMLNSIVQREHFPNTRVEEELHQLTGKRVFTLLDMMSGYLQIGVAEESRKYTAFVTPDGHYQFKRVPFGLSNSVSVFCRAMSKVVRPLRDQGISFYMDDVVIATETEEQNLALLERFLIEVAKSGMTLKVSKCEFFKRSIEYLGHIVAEGCVTPGETKTEAVEKFPVPTDARTVRQFLGLTGYFRRFVQNYGQIAAPLTRLTGKVSFIWGETEQKAFDNLKLALTRRPVLALYDPALQHQVHCDASSFGLAGILIQINLKNQTQPVMYFSRATTEIESRYHSYELEALAVVESLKKFRYYLLNKHFEVYTDCQSLALTKAKKELNHRIARWWMYTLQFSFDLKFRSGKQMDHVDSLSRNITRGTQDVEQVLSVNIDCFDWVAALQLQDGLKFVVPATVRFHVVKSLHDDMGHPGVDKTTELVKQDFWFEGMSAFIKQYIKCCIECAASKRGLDETRYQIHAHLKEPIPFWVVHIDYCGPFPRSKRQYTAAKTPRGNGQVERCFQFVTSALKCFTTGKDEREWDTNLPAVQWAMNTMKNRTTGESPHVILLGYRPRNVLNNKLLLALRDESDLTDEIKSLPDIRQKAQEQMTQNAEKQAARHNTTHKAPLTYNEGDLVLLRFEPPADGSSRKLMPRFRGPYIIHKVLGADRYVVKDTPSTQVTQKPFESVYAADKIKPWGQPPEDDFPEVEEDEEESTDADEQNPV